MQADEYGVKLEIVQENPVWEFFPSPLHQSIVQAIFLSVKPRTPGGNGCGCFCLMDAYVRFPDGSIKRPDMLILCERPPLTRDALTVVPEAVVEVVSPGSERKDLETGPPFYLSQGVKDVVVVNPETDSAWHFRRDGTVRRERPTSIALECGCSISV